MAPAVPVLAAFGAAQPPVLLDGGQGQTWRSGPIVLKPCALTAEAAWAAEVTIALAENPAFRVARPVRASDGTWVFSGWQAWEFVPGTADPRRVDDILRAANAFHRELDNLPRPSFLDTRDDPWTYGDRVAWQELPLPSSPALRELAAALQPVNLVSQAVHGDLLGNVLFADGLPPAIIDWPVYFRPPSWALAVAVVDALTWHAVEPDVLARWSDQPEWKQMLIRALIYRMVTDLRIGHDPQAYLPAADLVLLL